MYNVFVDLNLTVNILGDQDDALQFKEAQEVANGGSQNDDDSEHESDLPEVEVSLREIKYMRFKYYSLLVYSRLTERVKSYFMKNNFFLQEVVEVKKRRHLKSVQQVDPMEEKKKRLLEVHPLSVEITASLDSGLSLTATFHHYTKLKIITVTSKVNVPSSITGMTHSSCFRTSESE